MIVEQKGAKDTSILMLFFVLGVTAIRFIPVLWPTYSFALVGCVCIGLVFSTWPRSLVYWKSVLGFLIGFCWAGWSAHSVLENALPESLYGKHIEVTGQIVGLVEQLPRGQRFEFRVETLMSNGVHYHGPLKVRLRTYSQALSMVSGQRWAFRVKLKPPNDLQNPGGTFNYETWLFRKKIQAVGYVVEDSHRLLAQNASSWRLWWSKILHFRGRYADMQGQQVAEPATAKFLNALTVGVKTAFDAEDWRLLQNTGVAHLMAISGLHIGLVALLSGALAAAF